jgi:transcriptional regulator with XRE-family HTH domain
MNFAEIMRRLREDTGLTQAGLADRSGIPLRTIQGWEQGYRCPVSPAFFKLAKALGVDCAAFANVEDGEDKPSKAKGGGSKATVKPKGKLP